MRAISGLAFASVFGLAALGLAVPAQAVLVTKTYGYVGTGFSGGGAGAALVDTVSGRFTLTYDTTINNYIQFQGGLDAFSTDSSYASFNLGLSNLGFVHYEDSSSLYLVIGGLVNGYGAVNNKPDFYIAFSQFPDGEITGPNICYSQVPVGIFCNNPGASSVFEILPGGEPGAGGVPEPTSWAMLIAGFGLVGAVSRRRRMMAA